MDTYGKENGRACLTVFVLLSVVGCTQTIEQPTSLWKPERQVIYQYTAHVKTVTVLPVEATSEWSVRGLLDIQAISETSITVQLQEPEVSAMNGRSSKDQLPDVKWLEMPLEAAELSQPFKLQYNEHGQLMEMRVQEGEKPWAVNLKRGIASLLQLDLSTLQQPASIVKEKGLHGECVIGYMVQNDTQDNIITVSKTFNPSECSGSDVHTMSRAEKLRCPSSTTPQKMLSSSNQHMYVVKNHPTIHEVRANGGIFFQPFRAQGEMFHILTSQLLLLIHEGEITQQTKMKDEGVAVDLKFQRPIGDISLGRSPPKQEDLLSAVMEMLEALGDNLEHGKLETNPKHLHTEWIAHVLYILSLLDQTNLWHLYTNLAVGTSYHQETIRNLFMEILPQVGSRDAALLIRNLVISGAVKNDTAVNLLMSLPFYMQNPTEDLLPEFEGLLNEEKINPLVYQTAVLSFATLVSKVCSRECGIDVMEKYIQKYLDLLTSSEGDYGKQMLYVQALSNFDEDRVFEFLRPLIENKSKPRQLRFIAILATSGAVSVLQEQAYEAYWPLLNDRKESLEIRVAALSMLILSRPTLDRFYSLYWFMLSENAGHLQYYWYTTLESLMHSQYPCYAQIGEAARKMIRYFPKKHNYRNTGNYILDYANNEHGFGSLIHLSIIANPNTGLPGVLYLDVGHHADGLNFRQYSLYLRVEGVGNSAKGEVLSSHKKLNMDKLVELLKKLKLSRKSTPPAHIEIALKMQNKVILTQYINDALAKSLAGVFQIVSHLVQTGVHLNQQDLDMPFIMEQLHATDVGSPALLRVTAASFMSLRANLNLSNISSSSIQFDTRSGIRKSVGPSTDPCNLKFTKLKSDLMVYMRFSLSAQTALMSYNPVLNMWHGVQKSRNIQGNLPLNLTMIVKAPSTLTFTLHQEPGIEAGIVAHVQTAVSVRGVDAEEKLRVCCPTCDAYYVPTDTPNYPQEQSLMEVDMPKVGTFSVLILHCEHSENLVSTILDGADCHTNSRVLPQVMPLLKMLQLADFLLLVPPSGSCGILAKFSPPVGASPSELESTVQISFNVTPLTDYDLRKEYPDFAFNLLAELKHRHISDSESNPLMNLKIHYLLSSNKIQMEMDIHVVIKEQFQVCLLLEENIPQPQYWAPAFTPEGAVTMQLNVTWGQGEKCPLVSKNIHGLHETVSAGLLEEQMALVTQREEQPYSDCWQDVQDTEKWGTKYSPQSPACIEVAQELSTLRQYNTSVTIINFQPMPMQWIQQLGLPYLPFSPSETQEARLEVPKEGLGSYTMQQYKVVFSESTTAFLQPWLSNFRFSGITKLAKLRIFGTCTITTKSVITFDEENYDLNLSQCYTLATAECLEETASQFGVFVKRVNHAEYPLALELFIRGDQVEILPNKDKAIISLNGAVLKNATTGYQYPQDNALHYNLKIIQHDDGLVTLLSMSGISIHYYGHFATIGLFGLHQGSLCGLCGDHNSDELNDTFQEYSIPASD